MSGPLPQPGDSPETLGYRHVRTVAGLAGMILAAVSAIAIQVARNAHEAALLSKGCPVTAVLLPTSWLQFTYSLAIPVVLPLLLFVFSVMLFSPTLLSQLVTALRGLLPWNKG